MRGRVVVRPRDVCTLVDGQRRRGKRNVLHRTVFWLAVLVCGADDGLLGP